MGFEQEVRNCHGIIREINVECGEANPAKWVLSRKFGTVTEFVVVLVIEASLKPCGGDYNLHHTGITMRDFFPA